MRETDFGAVPTALRMRADPQATGKGVTLALVDSAFYPHADLCFPNRIRAWVNAEEETPLEIRFGSQDQPAWPGWDSGAGIQWHGMMTSTVAAGDGHRSDGLYRGLASDADVVLIQTSNQEGHIADASIFRALRWLQDHRREFGIRVANLSVAGDGPARRSPIDLLISALANDGVSVIAASGNDGVRKLVPPATAVDAITVGGIDDRNTFDPEEVELWHSNYGEAAGRIKPEVVAPSIWVVAPLLPGTQEAEEANELFELLRAGDPRAEPEIAQRNLVRPEYKLVEGTSFAAPIVSSVVCCMLEVNGKLTPSDVRRLLMESATRVPEAPAERQGAGVVNAGKAVALARNAIINR